MKHILINCHYCNKEFSKNLYQYNRYNKKHGYRFFCTKECNKLFNKHQGLLEINKNVEVYNLNPKKCLNCNVIIEYDKRVNNYCSRKCGAIHTQINGGHCKWSEEDKKRIREQSKKNPYFNGTIVPQRTKNFILSKNCLNCNNLFTPIHDKRKCCSRACYRIWIKNSGYMKGKGGGFREKSGRGKQGWYKGYFCNSSWELAWVIYNLENNISFIRNKDGFKYIFENKEYKFYPDFYLPNENKYIEIKGYKSSKYDSKVSQFPYKIDTLYKKDMDKYIDYTIKKYGKKFINLYENS